MNGILNGVVTLSWYNEHYPSNSKRAIKELCERTAEGKVTKLNSDEIAKSGNNWIVKYDAIVRLYGEPNQGEVK